MSEKIKGLIALLITIFFWSLAAVVARGVVNEIKPLTLLFIRLLVATIAFLPFLLTRKIWRHPQFMKLIKVSIFFMFNMTFFLLGIQYTSASASQLIYSITPILIIIIGVLFMKEKYSLSRLIGVLVGLVGVVFIVYLSAEEKGTTITGSLIGNLLIGLAVFGWLSYMLSTKKILKTFSPIDTSSVAIIVSFSLSIPLFAYELIGLKGLIHLSTNAILAGVYIGFFGTFLTYLLHQYALSRLSTLTASFSSYIQPITTAVLEIFLLREKITMGFLFGGALVFLGIFFTTTFELYSRRKKAA